MQIGVLGTGVVGRTIASGLTAAGHAVMLGSRFAPNEAGLAWATETAGESYEGDVTAAAEYGEVIFNCTPGSATMAVLDSIGPGPLAGKVLVDVSNPIAGVDPPRLTTSEGDSVGEMIQRTYPEARVVKTLNTVAARLMTNPDLVEGNHSMFISGNDHAAKQEVMELIGQLGWEHRHFVDLGDITGARVQEGYIFMFFRLLQTLDAETFNIGVHHTPPPGDGAETS